MESRLPVDKLERLKLLLDSTSNRKKICLRDLQSLIGLLNFACLVVSPGHAFLRRLIDLTCNVKKVIISFNIQLRLERIFKHGKKLSNISMAKLFSYKINGFLQIC